MKSPSRYRKPLKVSEAAQILNVSATTVKNMIAKGELREVPLPRTPGSTSPRKVYAAQIEQIARDWGLG